MWGPDGFLTILARKWIMFWWLSWDWIWVRGRKVLLDLIGQVLILNINFNRRKNEESKRLRTLRTETEMVITTAQLILWGFDTRQDQSLFMSSNLAENPTVSVAHSRRLWRVTYTSHPSWVSGWNDVTATVLMTEECSNCDDWCCALASLTAWSLFSHPVSFPSSDASIDETALRIRKIIHWVTLSE